MTIDEIISKIENTLTERKNQQADGHGRSNRT